MLKENLTFNDLPEVVGKLCERIESLENALKDNLAKQAPAKENLHVPMTVEEVCSYLGISKPGKRYCLYRDELDKWLETGRKSQVPLSFEEEHEQMLAAIRHKAKPREL